MRPAHVVITAALVGVVVASLSLRAAQSPPVNEQDGLIGTWQLNVEKSKYSPGPGPITETRTYTRGRNGLEGTIQRRFKDGRSERIEYVAEYDREYPVTGTEAYDHILLKRITAYVAEATLSHAGRIYGTARRVIAQDGKTMTIIPLVGKMT